MTAPVHLTAIAEAFTDWPLTCSVLALTVAWLAIDWGSGVIARAVVKRQRGR